MELPRAELTWCGVRRTYQHAVRSHKHAARIGAWEDISGATGISPTTLVGRLARPSGLSDPGIQNRIVNKFIADTGNAMLLGIEGKFSIVGTLTDIQEGTKFVKTKFIDVSIEAIYAEGAKSAQLEEGQRLIKELEMLERAFLAQPDVREKFKSKVEHTQRLDAYKKEQERVQIIKQKLASDDVQFRLTGSPVDVSREDIHINPSDSVATVIEKVREVYGLSELPNLRLIYKGKTSHNLEMEFAQWLAMVAPQSSPHTLLRKDVLSVMAAQIASGQKLEIDSELLYIEIHDIILRHQRPIAEYIMKHYPKYPLFRDTRKIIKENLDRYGERYGYVLFTEFQGKVSIPPDIIWEICGDDKYLSFDKIYTWMEGDADYISTDALRSMHSSVQTYFSGLNQFCEDVGKLTRGLMPEIQEKGADFVRVLRELFEKYQGEIIAHLSSERAAGTLDDLIDDNWENVFERDPYGEWKLKSDFDLGILTNIPEARIQQWTDKRGDGYVALAHYEAVKKFITDIYGSCERFMTEFKDRINLPCFTVSEFVREQVRAVLSYEEKGGAKVRSISSLCSALGLHESVVKQFIISELKHIIRRHYRDPLGYFDVELRKFYSDENLWEDTQIKRVFDWRKVNRFQKERYIAELATTLYDIAFGKDLPTFIQRPSDISIGTWIDMIMKGRAVKAPSVTIKADKVSDFEDIVAMFEDLDLVVDQDILDEMFESDAERITGAMFSKLVGIPITNLITKLRVHRVFELEEGFLHKSTRYDIYIEFTLRELIQQLVDKGFLIDTVWDKIDQSSGVLDKKIGIEIESDGGQHRKDGRGFAAKLSFKYNKLKNFYRIYEEKKGTTFWTDLNNINNRDNLKTFMNSIFANKDYEEYGLSQEEYEKYAKRLKDYYEGWKRSLDNDKKKEGLFDTGTLTDEWRDEHGIVSVGDMYQLRVPTWDGYTYRTLRGFPARLSCLFDQLMKDVVHASLVDHLINPDPQTDLSEYGEFEDAFVRCDVGAYRKLEEMTTKGEWMAVGAFDFR